MNTGDTEAGRIQSIRTQTLSKQLACVPKCRRTDSAKPFSLERKTSDKIVFFKAVLSVYAVVPIRWRHAQWHFYWMRLPISLFGAYNKTVFLFCYARCEFTGPEAYLMVPRVLWTTNFVWAQEFQFPEHAARGKVSSPQLCLMLAVRPLELTS